MTSRLADLRLMLSYAREDADAFARELADALEAANFDVLLDVDDIEVAADWQAKLGDMIRSVDTLVVIVTPGWIASKLCNWELEEALRQNKRIIPIVFKEPTETAPAPSEISRLNYIYFDGRKSFGAALKQLAPALRVNLAWIRDHTHYSESARLWESRQRDAAMLLRGAELKRAERWREDREANFPEISNSVSEFLQKSAENETLQEAVRKRSTSWTIAVFLIVPACLAVTNAYALWLNYQRLGEMGDTDLKAYSDLVARTSFLDDVAFSIILTGVLFSIGALWLSKNLSTRVLAGIVAAMTTLAVSGFVIVSILAADLVEQANELDEVAASNSFEVEACAPTVRRLLDRYREAEPSAPGPVNVAPCAPHDNEGRVYSTWLNEVAPKQYAPLFVLLILPVLGIVLMRLFRGRVS